VKCIFDAGANCIRCSRLGIDCSPHVPGKRKRLGPAERAAANGGLARGAGKGRRPRSPESEGSDEMSRPLAPFLQALPMLAQQCEVGSPATTEPEIDSLRRARSLPGVSLA